MLNEKETKKFSSSKRLSEWRERNERIIAFTAFFGGFVIETQTPVALETIVR
jgi:hypothetical protein